ncbi:unnamed protein product [Brugia pahangi]|uniref:C2H2-type domain-containing protein n=1 Tax=Brugia pahangi TaxID=6280 RepID=A0A0N4THB1_BRUPA|nr:unnamed protein product [Brugia pahangi]
MILFSKKLLYLVSVYETCVKQTDTKLITPERHKDRYPTDVLKNSADVASEIMCKDVEEVFIISRRHRTLSPARSDRQKYQRFRNKQYLCDICDSAFTLKHNIQTHLLLYHPNNEVYTKRIRGKRYRCLKCNSVRSS